MKTCKKMIRAVVLAGAIFALIACGNVGESPGGAPAGEGDAAAITVGSKNFTEQYILGELYAQVLEANGFSVEKQLDLGSEQLADRALQSGQIDLYPEYTGTALAAVLNYEGEFPDTPEETYEAARELYAERDPSATMLKPAPFDNNYGIFVRAEVAEQYGLETLEDLAEASPELVFVSFSEFQDREDGYPNMQENYGFDFERIEIVNSLGLRYQGVLQGDGDVGVGFTTDGQLTSDELVVMEDTKGIWPIYQPAPVVRTEVLEENPEIEGILNDLSSRLDIETMRELNGQVDLEQRNPEDVAREWLQEEGLIE